MALGELAYSIAVWLIPLVVAIVFHEVSHGLVARQLGDPTASEQGRLSLNPLRHVDPVGTIGLPLVLAIAGAPVFGWARPVPVEPSRMRNPRRDMVLVALAGPGMNLLLAALAAVGLGMILAGAPPQAELHGATRFLADNLFNLLLVNVFLAVFNLLPLPPLDGGHVVEGLLPRPAAARFARVARFGFPILMLLLVALPMMAPQANLVERIVAPVVQSIMRMFLGLVDLAI